MTRPTDLWDAANRAVTTGRVIACRGLVIVPDVVEIEGLANGHDATSTLVLRRDDGRTVSVYRLPDDELGDSTAVSRGKHRAMQTTLGIEDSP